MKLKTRLESVTWMTGGLAVGLTAWVLAFGVPSDSPHQPSVRFEQPAAAAVTTSPTPSTSPSAAETSAAPVKRAPIVVVPREEVPTTDPAPVVTSDPPSEATPTTEPATTEASNPDDDGIQGPQAPPVSRPAPQASATRPVTASPTEEVPAP
jgi:hypothetical protein